MNNHNMIYYLTVCKRPSRSDLQRNHVLECKENLKLVNPLREVRARIRAMDLGRHIRSGRYRIPRFSGCLSGFVETQVHAPLHEEE